MKIITLLALILIFINSDAQQKKHHWSASINYGLAGNFFVRSYDEVQNLPFQHNYFYKKNFLGSIQGFNIDYGLKNKRSALGFGYSVEIHKGKKNETVPFYGTEFVLHDFNLRHVENLYQFYYLFYPLKRNTDLDIFFGLLVANMHQQEIGIEGNQILVEERNNANSRLKEGGVVAGLHYKKQIDTHFYLGIKFCINYLQSVQTLESLTLTSALTYKFTKLKH